MKTGKKGIDFIKKFEGCKLTAYRCQAGIFTIGYGNTFYKNGSKVEAGDKITITEADNLFMDLLPRYERIVNIKIKVKLNQNQFDALVSHTYNTGGSNTLFRLINEGASESDIKSWWLNRYITANGKRSNGLIRRRTEEYDLFKEND